MVFYPPFQSYLTDEHKLKREMEQFGPVKKIQLVYDLDGKPRGYGFVEFEHERDMHGICPEVGLFFQKNI